MVATPIPARATQEQFALLRRYLDSRHDQGGMADMSALDYAAMVEDTHVLTHLVEYRLADIDRPGGGRLVGVALTDQMQDGLSMVYSFFDPDYPERSFGTHMILDHITRARARLLDYVYLGYWVDGCRKMSYKARFQPLQVLGPGGWSEFGAKAPSGLPAFEI